MYGQGMNDREKKYIYIIDEKWQRKTHKLSATPPIRFNQGMVEKQFIVNQTTICPMFS
jgi:hypothetical protein